jgi:hypothetical protein
MAVYEEKREHKNSGLTETHPIEIATVPSEKFLKNTLIPIKRTFRSKIAHLENTEMSINV